MRHGKKVNHLSRKTAHRKAMLANMACSLIEHKRINTTVAKAKALKQFIEPLITKSKAGNNVNSENGTHNRRIVFKNLRDKNAVTELFSAVSEKVGDRPGGYTRIIKLGNRLGDNADMAMIELVDFNEIYNAGKPRKQKTTRRGRKGKPSDTAAVAEKAPAEKSVVEQGTVKETVEKDPGVASVALVPPVVTADSQEEAKTQETTDDSEE